VWNLIKAMGYEHPIRTLDVGTINANASRAAKRTTYPEGTDSKKVLDEINTSLSKVAGHATAVKRTAHFAAGRYLENLPMHNLDDKDRIIQEKAAIRKGDISVLLEKEGSGRNGNDGPGDEAGDNVGDDPVMTLAVVTRLDRIIVSSDVS
jgi:hypothetical protein